jgi:pimeloyl-ACP methyl ester carboxylesterase
MIATIAAGATIVEIRMLSCKFTGKSDNQRPASECRASCFGSPMPALVLNGCTIHYRGQGSGVPVMLTPGGRWSGYVQRALAAALATECRVVTWDRRNTDGASDIVIAGASSEADIWADDLAALIRALDLAPCYVGEYAGCRTAPLLVLKHPELVKGLLLAWPSGGEVAAERLPRNFYRQYIKAALREGMDGVVALDRFAASIAHCPANRARLLAMAPADFVRQMAYWEAFFDTSGDLPIAGCRATAKEWQTIAVPAVVIAGNDAIHPAEAAQHLCRLMPNAQYHAPVVTVDEWEARFGVLPFPQVSDFQGERIAPVWRAFIQRLEA